MSGKGGPDLKKYMDKKVTCDPPAQAHCTCARFPVLVSAGEIALLWGPRILAALLPQQLPRPCRKCAAQRFSDLSSCAHAGF
jgi:hypothetical protein